MEAEQIGVFVNEKDAAIAADYGLLAFGLSKTLLNFPNDRKGTLMSDEGKKVWMEYVRRKTSTRGNDVVHIVQQQQHSGHGRHYCNQCGKGTCVCFFFSCFIIRGSVNLCVVLVVIYISNLFH